MQLELTAQFKKDLKLIRKRGYDIDLLGSVIDKLINNVPLDIKHNDHALKGKFTGFRECHITPDWLLIYLVEDDILVLTLTRTGSHSDLF